MSLEKELRKRVFINLNGASVWMDWFRTIEFENGNRYSIVIYKEQYKSHFRITLDNFAFNTKRELKEETVIETERKFFGLYRPKKTKEIIDTIDNYFLKIEEFEGC